MKKITIDDLPENSFFHFTHINNIEDIKENGLKSTVGENSAGIENTPKVFFSVGEIGILEIMEVWLRILINKIYGSKDILNLYNYERYEEKQERLITWADEFISQKYLDDSIRKGLLFEYFYNYLKERIYLVLDIEEGEDYLIDDLDEHKAKLNNEQASLEYLIAKEQYGPFSDFNTNQVDNWNMHTKTNTSISRDKIKQVTTNIGEEDVLSIVLEVYAKNKWKIEYRLLLDDFIEYAKNKELIKEGRGYDQNNNSRIYKRKVLTRSDKRI